MPLSPLDAALITASLNTDNREIGRCTVLRTGMNIPFTSGSDVPRVTVAVPARQAAAFVLDSRPN